MIADSACAVSPICPRYCCRRSAPVSGSVRQPRQPEQAVQRRAQLVAGVGQEGALRAVGGLGSVARARQRLFDLTPLGDVLDDPDRAALGRMRGVDGLAGDTSQEGAAVEAPRLDLDLRRFTARQQRAERGTDALVVVVAVPDDAPALPDQRARRPAVHLLETRVGEHEALVARDGDADRRVLQDRLALQPLALVFADVACVDAPGTRAGPSRSARPTPASTASRPTW